MPRDFFCAELPRDPQGFTGFLEFEEVNPFVRHLVGVEERDGPAALKRKRRERSDVAGAVLRRGRVAARTRTGVSDPGYT